MNGYDLKLINHIEKLTKLPIITSGGAGNFKHIEDLFKKQNLQVRHVEVFFILLIIIQSEFLLTLNKEVLIKKIK